MSTITQEQQDKIAAYFAGRNIPTGLGNKDAACSVAGINLSLFGRLSDEIPPCMSEVIGQWVIAAQDAMPDAMRNSAEWRRLLPLAAGTGREHEKERRAIIMDWMWCTVLPSLQHAADRGGFGDAWRRMTTERTSAAARAARVAADSARDAERAADAARGAADSARGAERAAAWAAQAAADAARGAADSARGAERAAAWAADAAWDADAAWAEFDPCGMLARLVEVV